MLGKEFSRSKHSIESKVELVRQRMFHEISFDDAVEKFGICRATLSSWMTKYRSEVLRRIPQEELPLYVLRNENNGTMSVEQELRARIAQLEHDLQLSKIERKIYEVICEKAKSELNYDIKKNLDRQLLQMLPDGSELKKDLPKEIQ